MSDRDDLLRLVIPRRWVLAGSVATLGVLAAARPMLAEGGEGGESGAAVGLEGDAGFLVELGLFEATHLIVAALYAEGATARAQEHLELSHHAYYEDLEHELEDHGAVQFEAEAEAFAEAVATGADAATVAGAADAVLAAIVAARRPANAKGRMQAAERLVRLAADDFAGGVDGGKVAEPQEYRDAWGFAEAARRMMAELAQSPDAAVAEAGKGGLAALEPVAALFPALTAETVPGEPSVLAGAAARIEIAGLSLD